jgi:hypothetical protein
MTAEEAMTVTIVRIAPGEHEQDSQCVALLMYRDSVSPPEGLTVPLLFTYAGMSTNAQDQCDASESLASDGPQSSARCSLWR